MNLESSIPVASHSMTPFDADVLIVGGGLVGAALALALRESKLKVLLLESSNPDFTHAAAEWDSRIYAISGSSRRLLERIGAWQGLDAARLQAVQAMRIFGDAGAKLSFDAPEAGLEQLACILESRELQQALWRAAQASPHIELRSGVELAGLQVDADAATLSLAGGQRLRGRLVVGADGARSWLREQAGIKPKGFNYRQFGVVANFATSKPHLGTAYQWFSEDSILAWLPLAGSRMSMVWSCNESQKDELLALDADELAKKVAAAGGHQLGDLQLITAPAAFPLRINHVPQLVLPRVALIGDAAHTVHPLAGQGVNLGFGDVAELAGILRDEAVSSCGDFAVLRRYERARREPVYRMQAVCHGLQKLFNNPNPLLKLIRNSGLGLTDQSGWLKRQLIRQAMHS